MAKSKIPWDEIEKQICAGADKTAVCAKYGITKANLHVRSHRYKWPTPERILDAASAGVALRQKKIEDNEKAIQSAAETLIQRGEQSSIIASELLLKLLEKAQKDPARIKDLGNVGDLATAVTTARKIAGMDKEKSENTVNLSLAMFSNDDQQPRFRVIDEDDDG